ncbi:MAG: hydantoinase/oxoprolinase family protein, partial [Betaproteobacteria bacterium]|nr:hydantoinase/oxoprolinase family protein [Betaproteobacteria bacterium]
QFLAVLQRQQSEIPHASQMRFAQALSADPAHLGRLNDSELRAWERLCQGPVDLEAANIHDRDLARAVARLERKGLAIYTGFTPSDAAHVLGMSNHWNAEAAICAARIWARQMRHMYGLGKWPLGDAVAPARDVVAKVTDTICQKLIEAGLNDAGQMNESNAGKVATLLTAMALGRNASGPAVKPADADAQHPVFALQFSPDLPLVGVGAPAGSYYPAVAHGLGVQLVVPPHAHVANAVGAVLGQVAQRVHMTVTQPVRGTFKVFTPGGPVDFRKLDEALDHARTLAAEEARARALAAGAAAVELSFGQLDNRVENEIDGDVFFESTVSVTASGPPLRKPVAA